MARPQRVTEAPSRIVSCSPNGASRLLLSRHSNKQIPETDLEDIVTELDPDVENALYAAIREHSRIHAKQEQLECILGRSALVAEWASAAGYMDSMSMLAALREGQKAQTKLVKSQRAMVRAIAKKYAFITKSLTLDDLIQEGNLGLLSAADKFDPDKGARFGTYAAFRVKASVLRAIANKDRQIRIPVHIQDVAGKVRSATQRLQVTLGRPPTDAEIAATLDMLPSEVTAHREMMDKEAVTVNAVSDRDVMAFAARATPQARSEMVEDLKRVLELYLAPKEIEALQLRFGLDGQAAGPLTFKEVGGSMQTSAEGIRRIVSRALDKLREGEAWRLLSDYAEFA
ncbi:hypothetical protein JKP88DRAFT_259305 [Tribonema minus]|uniref:RNA polymerase sigma-70 domain-containing protein n=1 Tax=Tribonema minus TaxID=303371 RepID=A0A835ZDU2_9STRA|nr:hypothetical protein JKP88DRAFT_259305 [Tribonema minus]